MVAPKLPSDDLFGDEDRLPSIESEEAPAPVERTAAQLRVHEVIRLTRERQRKERNADEVEAQQDRSLSGVTAERSTEAADEFEQLLTQDVGAKPPQKFLKPEVLRAEVEAMLKGQLGWDKADANHFVELSSGFHERIYGVSDEEVRSRNVRMIVMRCAGSMLRGSFKGDAAEMADFVKWAWRRERGREEWRRKNRRDGGRMSVRNVFSQRTLTDYRVAKSRDT